MWAKPAVSDLLALDQSTRARVVSAIADFASVGVGDVTKLAGRAGEYRLRVGDYRAIFVLTPGVVLVKRVRHRREVYR